MSARAKRVTNLSFFAEICQRHSKASHSGESIDHRQNIGGNVAVIQLTDRQTNIVSLLLKKEDITARQVAVIMDIPLRTIERELSVLKKKGVIQHIGSPRAGRWIVLGNY